MTDYGNARRQRVDPRGIRSGQPGHRYDQKAVDQYRNGTRSWWGKDDNDEPFLRIDEHGRKSWVNGAHRARAAELDGKKITARVHDERVSGPAAAASGCMVMTVTLVGVVVLGLARMRRGR